MSPSARSIAEAKRRGWLAQNVEQTIPRTFIKRDLFGVVDIVAVSDVVIGIQATGGGNHSKRRAKILAESRMRQWLAAGARLLIWSWEKRGPRGKRKTWTLREQEIALADFEVQP
jgi:hypothetical protein